MQKELENTINYKKSTPIVWHNYMEVVQLRSGVTSVAKWCVIQP